MTSKLAARSFELRPKFAEVVDLSVEDDPVAGLLVLHGLMAEGRKIEYGEASVAESELQRFRRSLPNDDRAGIVRTTVGNRTGGVLQIFRSKLGITRQDSDDATHNL
jgi:hypothetical protein